ncbi:MAG TPA: hypothetical protein VLX92_02105 [Kofleriaceae bacterium]|nr:hypothetical protein [Kofleriaceae bacterium]
MRSHLRYLVWVACAACSSSNPGTSAPDASAADAPAVDAAPVDGGGSALPALQFCTVADPTNLAGAFASTTDGQYVHYTCVTPCADYTQCQFGLVDASGQPIVSARGKLPIQALAFVVDGLAGHFAFTSDGNDVVITHAGAGGVATVNTFDRYLQQGSDLKTVTLGWEPGTTAIQGGNGGGGWFTRPDASPTTVRALTARPAAAIQWVKDHFAAGQKLGTVGSSMGTAATFGAHVWQGLDAILDYQMLIGGPGFWDVNLGCGRVHQAAGFCDVDAAPCTGNAMSSFGNDDPVCPGSDTTNNCRVATVMAPQTGSPTGSAYDDIINYVGMTTSCSPQTTDARDASLDASSLAMTVPSWTFHGTIDFVTNEGGTQPPDADQGMGEGHMLQIYNAIQSAKSWTDNQGAHHGDSFDKVPALIQASAAKVIAGMQ